MRYTSTALKDWADDLKKRVQQGLELGVQRAEAYRAGVQRARGGGMVSKPTERSDRAVVEAEELPIVSRLVVEIRSDGSRTLARGAIEDVATGQRTAVEARGDSPAQLAAALAGTLLTAPLRLGRVAGGLLSARLRRER